MDEPGDVNLDRPIPPESSDFTPRRRRPVALIAVVAVLVLALGGGYLYLRRTPSEPAAPAAVATAPARPAAGAEEEIALPPLDETDPIVRDLVSKLSSHPAVAAWLTTDGLLLNFVVVTTRIANGEAPNAELKALGTVPRFTLRESRDTLYMDPSSYRRYDRYAEAIAELDARGTARLYQMVKPRVVDAYGRLGGRGAEFDPVLERAIVEMLEVPVVEGNIELVPHGTVYAYADERLQRLTAPQKQLLRMGPENVRRIQAKLREIADYLAIPASRLPPA